MSLELAVEIFCWTLTLLGVAISLYALGIAVSCIREDWRIQREDWRIQRELKQLQAQGKRPGLWARKTNMEKRL